MKENKWLLRKKSGSRNHYKRNWLDYERPDHKAEFQHEDVEEKFAKVEGMVTKDKNGIDTTLVKKWLYSQVGKNFDDVYAEFLTRVQPKYLDTHKDCIFWYVEKGNEIVIKDDKVYVYWGSRYIDKSRNYIETERGYYRELLGGFYINPDTNILCRVVEAKKRTMTHKEGKKKHAEYITDRNKTYTNRKVRDEQESEKAFIAMKEKKKSKTETEIS